LTITVTNADDLMTHEVRVTVRTAEKEKLDEKTVQQEEE
jgi:hypothetical protein